ncbi:unnamed protein product [Nezara viridula]|uniref:Fatty acyl-CoA reductase n=1 Tax=Nezara viridula TaxID=85310 RepID=A0A9P0MXP9_NEZVI|nr:unnamed protein product [Nezara viridula]
MANMKNLTIKEYFEGQSIFITGNTGTMGKVLIEKLLRCCPGVARLYLLIRGKKNISSEERWKAITELPLFDVLKKSNPEALAKVTLIEGDILKDDMDLSEEDKQCLLENVTIVYHMAALVQFSDSMTLALINNTKSTHMLLEFARRMKKLQLFHHVSTAFCNMNVPCDKAIEEVIPATLDWRVIMKLLETQPLILENLKEKLLFGHPNPYTWSKWLTEQIVDEYKIYFPIVITRPASVSSTVRDPFPGWLDSNNGICGFTNAIGFGLLRIAFAKEDNYTDFIPADASINTMIVASWKKYKEPAPERTDVYNSCLIKDIKITGSDYVRLGRPAMVKYPSKHIVWPSHVVMTTNELWYKILFILLQLVPAVLVDLFCLVRNKKRRAVNMTIKSANMLRIYKEFTKRKLGFPNDKFKALNNDIPDEEWDTFNTVYKGLTKEYLISIGYKSIVKYYLKEEINEESMIKNKRRYFWLIVIDEIMIFCFWMFGGYLLTKILGSML